MSRLTPNSNTNRVFHVPPPSSTAIASTVSSYMATRSPTAKGQQQQQTGTPSGRKAKQKLKLKKANAGSSVDAATAPNPGVNFCRNPFCGAPLESRASQYCIKKSYCQLYRGLQLNCGSFTSEHERAVDEAIDNLREAKRRRLRKSAAVESGDDDDDDDSENEEARRAAAKEKQQAKATVSTAFSIPKRKIPVAPSPTELSKEERRAQKKLQRRMVRQEEAANEGQASVESSDAEQPMNGRKRRRILDLRGESSSASTSTITTATTPGSNAQAKATGTPFRPPTPTGGIEVIPLGAGRHPSSFGGGSRYVQSGNRTAMNNLRVSNPLVRQPNGTSATAVTTAAPSSLPPVAPARSEPVDQRLQSRATSSGSAVPTPRASPTDPRRADYSTTRSEIITPLSSSVVSQAPPVPQPAPAANRVTQPPPTTTAKRIISASEYMSNRKPQDPRVRTTLSTTTSGDLPPLGSSASLQRSSSELSNTPVSSSYLNGAPPLSTSRERTFSRSQSDSDVLRSSFTGRDSQHGHHTEASRRPSTGDHVAATTPSGARIPVRHPSAERPYSRSSSYDEGSSSYGRRDTGYDSRDGSSFGTERTLPLPPRLYSPDRYHDNAYEPEYHRPSLSLYPPQDQSHWQRRQEDASSSSRRGDEASRAPPLYHPFPGRDPGLSSPSPMSRITTDHSVERVGTSISNEQRDVNVHPEILPVAFSSHDRFIVNLLSRFASFFPKALAPVLNKTKKPRKMRFYLDYVERVKQLAGCQLDVQVADGRGVVTVEGREWLVLKGQSTVDLYTQILETLLEQGIAWKKLVDDSNRVYSHAVKRVGGNRGTGDRSEAFLRMWRGMKVRLWQDFPTERQVTYFRGSKRHHWSFCVGNVEIGSGSHEEKNEALRLGGDASMKFLLSLEILNEREKYSGESTTTRSDTRRYDSVDRDSDSSQQRASSARDILPPRATRSSSSTNNSSSAARQTERSSTSATPTAAASRPAAVSVVGIVETPDVTVTRVRDDSFSSNADGAFSPVTQSDPSVTEEDMEISDVDGT